jgi:cyclophilin family peptidyl-prolyl cis-trans isomerase
MSTGMRRLALSFVLVALVSAPAWAQATAPAAPPAGPVVVVETSRGIFEFETFPTEAPRTVARILELVKSRFYNGMRVHRVVPGFVIQMGDPQTRDMTKKEAWGTGGSGKPIGAAEITKKRRHGPGAVGMGHAGSAKDADSQFYITLRDAPSLDGKYAVWGRVIKGLDVAAKIQKGDVRQKVSVRE